MTLNFPTNPALNDTYTYNGTTFTWDGEKWDGSLSLQVDTANIIDDSVTPAKISTGGPSWNTSGDTIITTAGQGVILTSPNGTQYRITVDNSGNLSTAVV